MPEAKKTRRLKGIRTVHNCQFFNINAQQITDGMSGIVLTNFADYVEITHPGFPHQVKQIMNAGILERTLVEE